MSSGVNYSKWDNMDYGSSDDEQEGMDTEAQPRVTTLDGPSSVTFGGGTDTVTAQSSSSGGGGGCMFAQAAKAKQQKKQTQEEEWTSNGSNIRDKLYWCQDRHSVTMRQQVPKGVESKDILVKLKGALSYQDRHSAVVSARTEATPSLLIQVQGIPILTGDMPYPCHLEEDHEEGEELIDWTLETFEANKAQEDNKFITLTFFKAVPMEGVTLWWNKPLNHLPEIDITKCQGRTKGKSNFQQNFNEAEAQFKAQLQQQQQQQQQQQSPASAAAPPNPKQVHKLVTKRYKELRKEGIDLKEAMVIARREYGLDKMDNVDVGTQVATMFGMPM